MMSLKTNSKKILKRIPGREIVVEATLVETPDQPSKADPNGYYECLGLDPRRSWTSDEIKRAYWVKAKKYHPDGVSPNPDEFRRVQMAYAVLKDPEMRSEYDELDPAKAWIDEDIVAAIIKNLISERSDEKDLTSIIRERLAHEGEEEPAPSPEPPKPRFESFAYYYYEGETPPTKEVRDRWIECIVKTMLERRSHGVVRIGYSEGGSHVIKESWGKIMMASGKPTQKAAEKLLDLMA